MLTKWLRSPGGAHFSSKQPPSPRYFSCSSFKDINNILLEELQNGSKSEPESPRKPSIFHRVRLATSRLLHCSHYRSKISILSPPPNHSDHHIVVYFTSLRIVRRTFEDCRTVRSILLGYRVPIDERDLSMDGRYLDELQEITGSKKVSLPVVFIGGKHVGGAEKIKEMNESGELKMLIGRLSFVENSNGCDLCGGLRFVLCEQCNGSHKIYSKKLGFRICTFCNVNGLIRCGLCSPVESRRLSTS